SPKAAGAATTPSTEEMMTELMDRASQIENRLSDLNREQQQLKKAFEEVQALKATLAARLDAPAPAAGPAPSPAPSPAPPIAPAAVAPARETLAPLFFRIGAAEFTPGGFLDMVGIYRSTNVGSGIGTGFGSIPYANTTAGKLSETRFSAQGSRISMKIE